MPTSLRSALCALLTLALDPAAAAATASQTAEYTVTFQSTWSAETHPVDYPSNSHFSGLIGTTHDATVSFWQTGSAGEPGDREHGRDRLQIATARRNCLQRRPPVARMPCSQEEGSIPVRAASRSPSRST